MKYSKLLLSALSIFISTNALSAPFVNVQIGAAHGNSSPLVIGEHTNNKFGFTGRLSGGYLWDTTEKLKLGLEAGIQDFQNIDVNYNNVVNVTSKRWTVDALAIADYFVTDRFDVFAKLGTAYVHQHYPTTFNGSRSIDGERLYLFINGRPLETQTHFVPKAVVGLGYNILSDVNLNFSISHDTKNNDKMIPGVRSYLVGAKYSFS